MITTSNNILPNRAEVDLPPDLLLTILGPTASGKTKLAVALAEHLVGEIISVDSRQVYKQMDIGTGKDLREYGSIPYHLIDILNPGEKYNVWQFTTDFERAYTDIISRKKQVIACGGTGMYFQALFQSQPYIDVPIDLVLRETLLKQSKEELIDLLHNFTIPSDYTIDKSSHKRLIRAIEILSWLHQNPEPLQKSTTPPYPYLVFGLNPALEKRRENISIRLSQRIEQGLLDEIESLLEQGVTHTDLQYYGLEYKYGSLFLAGEIDEIYFKTKLETEIHRYAKRQMTFFRKMEKDGVHIHWLDSIDTSDQVAEILQHIKSKKRDSRRYPFSIL